eukprot:g3966.t1
MLERGFRFFYSRVHQSSDLLDCSEGVHHHPAPCLVAARGARTADAGLRLHAAPEPVTGAEQHRADRQRQL